MPINKIGRCPVYRKPIDERLASSRLAVVTLTRGLLPRGRRQQCELDGLFTHAVLGE